MPLFGKKDKKMEMPEVVDFSNDLWSFKGEPPVYQIQSDGFSYDIVDSDGNDKNAISLGIAGMLIIVLNAKSPKIREDELLPQFGKVIKTRTWHSMTVKEANFLVQTAIKKLTSSAMSGDVFDLASYAPLEVKRVLLKTLFTISRTQMKPEFREEAEHRIIDDIVPDIFMNPEYELALLTGLIVKPDEKTPENSTSTRIETKPILDPVSPVVPQKKNDVPYVPEYPAVEEDSAFAELQKIYGRKADSPQVRAVSAQRTSAVPASETSAPAVSGQSGEKPETDNAVQAAPVNPFAVKEPVSTSNNPIPDFSAQPLNNPFVQNETGNAAPEAPVSGINYQNSQPVNPFGQMEPKSIPQPAAPNFSVPQPNNPFSSPGPRNIPQPPALGFSAPQPNSPMGSQDGNTIYSQNQAIPQHPMPNFGVPQGMNPFAAPNIVGNAQNQNMGYPQANPYAGNMQGYPVQMRMPNPQMPQQGYPQQMWQQNMQGQQNFNPYQQNPAFNPNADRQNMPPYPTWPGQQQNLQQPPAQSGQSGQNSENA